jgi:hypothetical protein
VASGQTRIEENGVVTHQPPALLEVLPAPSIADDDTDEVSRQTT